MTAPASAQRVVWEPTPKQAEFLACDDFEVLYGGAAGGGKTDALLIDAWCLAHGAVNNPHHRAVIFRRTFKELSDLIDRANELYPQFIRGIKYNKTEHVFTAPSGAKLELAYLHNDAQRFQYRGRAWNYIGWEEVTLWGSPVAYNYIKSRCRTTDRSLPRYIRATTNPDGPGQIWVMKRWGIQEDGRPSLLVFDEEFEELQPDGTTKLVPRKVRRRFIPAKLKDNVHLLGTGYRETLLDLPPEDREALLQGLWTGNRIRGAYYLKEMQRARAEGRLRSVPHLNGTPVNTFWDLGWNDNNSIWFHQRATLQDRFIHAYENSGEKLDHYVAYLQKLQTERGYVYGTHYLPHDAENESLTSESMLQMIRRMMPGQRFEVVPRIDHVLTGIQQTRAAFGSCWFDSEECVDGVAALDAYRKKWNSKQEVFLDEPEHDRFSNFADAFRQFGQGFAAVRNTTSSGRGRGSNRQGGGWKGA